MISRDELLAYLDEELRTQAFSDYCPNGLQVHGRTRVAHVATCPSVSLAFFEQAIATGADSLLVHHGLFWSKDPQVIHPHLGRRLRLLLEGDVNLVAYHLPLDAHPELGNNAQLANLLGLTARDHGFGSIGPTPIGVSGDLPAPGSLESLADSLAEALQTAPQIIPAGGGSIRRVGIVSGGGGDISMVLQCAQTGCQALVTGNIHEQTVAVAREMGVGLVAAGHYNTEKLGVRALGDHLAARFGIRVDHLDVPNPI